MYSLTGRDLPQTVRERMKKPAPATSSNVRITSPEAFNRTQEKKEQFPRSSTPRGAAATTVSQDASKTRRSSVESPVHGDTEFSPIAKKSFALSATPTDIDFKPSWSSANQSSRSSLSSSNQSASSADEPTKRTFTSSVHSSQPWKSSVTSASRRSDVGAKTKSPPPCLDTPKRNRSSAIMARAAFWDNKVTHGEESGDSEFPELPEDSFKR